VSEAIKRFFVVLIGLLRSERGVARARILVAGTIAASAIAIAVGTTVVTPPPPGTCDSTISSGSVSTALASVPAGGVLCLNNGTYSYNAAVSKASLTTVKPVPGASVTYSSLSMSTSNNIRIEGPGTIPGFAIGTNTSSGTNLQISNFTSNSNACIQAPQNVANNILIDKIVFNNIGQSCTEGRLGIHGLNTSKSVNQNIQVKNSTFTGSGPSDGIQGTGEPRGIIIGPGNTFQNILEGGCGVVHCDSIQCYGCSDVRVRGNYFYNNSTLAVDFDCNSGYTEMTDNVFYQEPASAANAVVITGSPSPLIAHNTFGPNTNLQIYGGNPGNCTTTNANISNNISQGGFNIGNCTGCTQTNNISNPIYVGGSTPTTWAGWALASNSPGKGTATDGGDVGARQACAPGSC